MAELNKVKIKQGKYFLSQNYDTIQIRNHRHMTNATTERNVKRRQLSSVKIKAFFFGSSGENYQNDELGPRWNRGRNTVSDFY